jgi:hypothetical protein
VSSIKVKEEEVGLCGSENKLRLKAHGNNGKIQRLSTIG